MTKKKLWHLIEAYRMSGGREEHHARKEVLDLAISEATHESLIASQAKRLALELECLLTDTKDTAVQSKWWDSAHEALQLYRDACAEAYKEQQ